MTETTERAVLRDRLYEAYASEHAGCSGARAVEMVYRRDIRPALPTPHDGPLLDIGCGQGELVRLLLKEGYEAVGVDVSPEQVALAHQAGLDQILRGDYRDFLAARRGQLAAVTATDLLEHLTKTEVIQTFDAVVAALRPGGVFIARVPNAVSPFGGHFRHGDFTHESWFTSRSVRQLAKAAGFRSIAVKSCPPPVHGPVSAVRAVLWALISVVLQIALAIETGMLHGHVVTQNLVFIARKPA